MADELFDQGLAIRKEVLGSEHVDRSLARRNALTSDFQGFITRYAWGEVWTRPGLDRKVRSCITVAMLVALNRPDELVLHLRGAIRNGVTISELREVLMHSAIYCGVPAANSAFRIAQETLGNLMDEETAKAPG